jgi:hypothetical protein
LSFLANENRDEPKKEGPAYSAGPSYEINEGFSSSLQLSWL